MRRFRLVERFSPALIGIAVLTILAGVVLLWLSWVLNTPAPDVGGGDVPIMVEKGMTLRQVAEMLDRRGLLRSRTAFLWAARLMEVDKRIQPGAYLIPRAATNVEILRFLLRPVAASVDVTIPEGLTIRQTAGLLASRIGIDSAEFCRSAEDSFLLGELDIPGPSVEGFLFPNTYNLYPGMSARSVIRKMAGEFHLQVDDTLRALIDRRKMSLLEVVTLASIIEGEVMIGDEAPVVSAVYHNRLRKRMPLEADPTIQYIIHDGPRRLYRSDLAIDSPYNTYRRTGLPPGPINSPGLRAIRAALNPADVDFIYFVAQGDGSHHFSSSYNDFLKAKQKLQALRRELAASRGSDG